MQARSDGAVADGPGADAGGPPASAGLACEALNEAAAQLGARCTGGALADWRALEASITDCAAYDRHAAEGLVEYHPEAFAACLQKFQAPCDEANPYPCQYEVLLGKVPDGQSCRDYEVCGPVSTCFNLGDNVCGDICGRFGNEGEPCGLHCGPGPLCLEGSFCTSGLYCANGTCAKSKQLGEPCGGADQVPCADPFFCKLADPTDSASLGSCVRRVPGGACTDDSACPRTQSCQAPGRCVPRLPAGASCDYAPGSCEMWTTCDGAGARTCGPAGRVGQPCPTIVGTDNFTSCITGQCDGFLCQPLSFAGGSCASAVCVQGTFCDPASQTCLACGADGGVPASDAGAADAGACSDLQLLGSAVTEVERTGTPPSPTGGDVTDGAYVLTSWEIYPPGSASLPRQHRITLRKLGTRLDIVSQSSDLPELTLDGTAVFTTTGVSATLAYTCGADGSFVLSYSATADTLVLFDDTGDVETFALQP